MTNLICIGKRGVRGEHFVTRLPEQGDRARYGSGVMLVEAVIHAARRWPERPVMVDAGGFALSFAALDRVSDELAAGFAARGVRPGHVVSLVLPSRIEYLVAYVAIAKLGAITAGVNPRLAPPERTRLVNDVAQADWCVLDPQLADGMAIAPAVIEASRAESETALWQAQRVAGAVPPPLPPDPQRAVAIVFTSGTTGLPKAAVFTERILADIAVIDRGNGWGEDGPITGNTQFCHIGFMGKLPAQIACGTTVHMVEPWRARSVLEAVATHRMPAVGGVAPQIALMLREPSFDDFDFSHVKLIVCGGAPASAALIAEAKERFGAGWTQRYSCTESGAVGTFTWTDADEGEMLLTVGRPRPGIAVEVRDAEDRLLPLGEVGEVCLRSAANMKEYWRNPEATHVALRGGWLHTGDQGFIDERGCLHLVGRRGEGYSRGGYVVYPVEVENVLAWHDKVAQVVVVPRPDEVMGDVGVAVVVPADPQQPPSLDELRAHAAPHIARYKLPEDLKIVDALPLTAMLKIDRRKLAEH